MTQSNIEWRRAKAEQVQREQVEAIQRSQCPISDFAMGFVGAYYSVYLLNDLRFGYWQQAIANAVQERRQDLRNGKHAALFAMPVLVNGELVAVQEHS